MYDAIYSVVYVLESNAYVTQYNKMDISSLFWDNEQNSV